MARAGEWLGSFEPDEAAFEGFIVSCVSGMDAPVKPYALTKRRNTTYLAGLDPHAREERRAQMLAATTRLNKVGPALAALPGVHALTDVTGFGLLGHLLEICRGAGLAAKVSAARLPVMPAAVGFAKQGIGPGAIGRNLASYGLSVNFEEGVEEWQRSVMADAQTSGGLMVACDPASADEVLEVFRQGGFTDATVIGRMEAGLPKVHVSA